MAFILLGIFAVILVFFMLRLQSLIMTTQQPAPTEVVNTPETIQQQPTVLVVATATDTPIPPSPPTAAAPAVATATNCAATNNSGYQVYGSLVIGAIHVGAIDDRGYNQAHDEGLQQMVERIPDVRVITAENVPETEEVLGVIDQMIQQGAKLSLCKALISAFAIQAAEEHPDVTFLHPGGFELRPNLAPIGPTTMKPCIWPVLRRAAPPNQ
ncbi:MAG: hypothetical protein R2867_34470 [Caldilineaceae bacterium]